MTTCENKTIDEQSKMSRFVEEELLDDRSMLRVCEESCLKKDVDEFFGWAIQDIKDQISMESDLGKKQKIKARYSE